MTEEFNHRRTLETFEEQIKILRDHGYNPLAVSQMLHEDVFVFATEEEAIDASNELEFNLDESKNKLQAWWYGLEYFKETVLSYESEWKCRVRIYWLDENARMKYENI